MSIHWYGLDARLHTVDHEAIDLDQAYEVVDRYFAQLRPHYESAEEALAATMFGFARPDGSYMQLCIHGANAIDVEHDFSLVRNPLLRLVAGRRQRDEHLTSRDQVRARTKLFFTLSADAFRQALWNERVDRRRGAGGVGA